MWGAPPLAILVADDSPEAIADYRSILCPPKTYISSDFGNTYDLADDIFGTVLGHDAFPDIDLSVAGRSEDAVDLVSRAVARNQRYAAAFIGVELREGDRGIEAAEAIRALDPELPIVLVAAGCGMHPVDVCDRLPPADRVFVLVKPFHAAVIQQLALGLMARRRAEQAARARAAHWRGLAGALGELPAGLAQYDKAGRLVYANRWMQAALAGAGAPGPQERPGAGRDAVPWPDLPRSPLPARDGAPGRVSIIALDGGGRVLELECAVPGGGMCRLYVDLTALAETDPAGPGATPPADRVPKIPLRQADPRRSDDAQGAAIAVPAGRSRSRGRGPPCGAGRAD